MILRRTDAGLATVADVGGALATGGGHPLSRLPVEVQGLGEERLSGIIPVKEREEEGEII